MESYKHELKIKLTFYPKDFKFSSHTKREAFEKELIDVIKLGYLDRFKESDINELEFDGEFVKHHGMRPHGTLLRHIDDDFIFFIRDFYDIKVEEEEEENVLAKEEKK